MQILQNLKDTIIIKLRFDIDLHLLLTSLVRYLIFNYRENTIVISLNAYFAKWFFLARIRQDDNYVRAYETTFVQEFNAFL